LPNEQPEFLAAHSIFNTIPAMKTLLCFLLTSLAVLSLSCASKPTRSDVEADELYSRLMAVVKAKQRRTVPSIDTSLDPLGAPFSPGQPPNKLSAEDRRITGVWRSAPDCIMLINSNHDLLIVNVHDIGRLGVDGQLAIKRKEPFSREEFSLEKGRIMRIIDDQFEEFTRK
jgi:hypothetical protein